MEYVRVIIHIKRVWLAVRFNCKLSFIIRNELSEKICEIDNTYGLFKGECLVNQTMYFQLPMDVATNRCKKLKLIVMMISANGMVPAGFINFNTHPKSPYEHFQAIMPIQRCEDTRAQIKFMHMYENCTKTPIQNSYINHLINKHDQNLYENAGGMAKGSQKNSQSVNRENVSARKYRQRESFMQSNVQKVNFSKPLVSPRTLTRHIQGSMTEKSIKINSFQQNQITEQKQLNQSSINPLTKQQLMKQHQQYWLQIIRLEEEVETLKQQNNKAKEQTKELKDYYEGHEEKIHAFIGQLQENTQTIKRLQIQVEQQRYIISQKQQFQKQSQNLRETQANQLRDILHKYADSNQSLLKIRQDYKALALQQEMATQKIIFLQSEAKRYAHDKLELKQQVSSFENKMVLLQESNKIKEENIGNLNNRITQQVKQIQSLLSNMEQVNRTLNNQIQSYKFQQIKFQEKISNLQNDLIANIHEKQRLAQESSQKDQEALHAFAKNAQLVKQLQEIKNKYEMGMQQSSIHQSKIKIYEKQLQFTSKEKQDFIFQLRRKEQELNELKSQLEEVEERNKMISIKLIEYQASLSGKSSFIEELKAQLQSQRKEKNQLLMRNMSIEQQFEQMYSILTKETEEKNEITILLTTIKENYKVVEQEKDDLIAKNKAMSQKNEKARQQCEKAKAQLQKASFQFEQTKQQFSSLKTQQNQSLQKINDLQLELQATLLKLQDQKNNIKNQYQDSYNQSMTSLMLKYAKLQQQQLEINQLLDKEKIENRSWAEKYNEKDNQIAELKKFTHNKLLENLKFMKEKQEAQGKLSQLNGKINNFQAEIQVKNKAIEDLKAYHQENLVKIDQLTNELQFVTQVLQRQRQQKSDIEKDLDHLDNELPQITQAAQLKEQSFDEMKLGQVNLQIESKVFTNEQPFDEAGDKKKKKK